MMSKSVRTDRSLSLAILAALSLGLAACGDKAPTGQVVASVNGDEVTRRELIAEPEAANLPPGSDVEAVLPALLGGVIERKLAVQEAERLKLDETPEYVSQQRRTNEILLTQQLFQRWSKEIAEPTKAEIDAYVAANPQMFAARKLILLDQIATSRDGLDENALKPLNSNDEIAAYFNSTNRKFQRSRQPVDSAKLPKPLYTQLMRSPPGYPLAMVQGNAVRIVAALQTRDAPPSQEERTQAATGALKQAKIIEKLSALRKAAKIDYQPGFKPDAAPGAATGKDGAAPAGPATKS